MARPKQGKTETIRPFTADEIVRIRSIIKPLLLEDTDLAARIDSLFRNWNAVQNAIADKDIRLNKLRRLLFLAMGILPSSEKQKIPEVKPKGFGKSKNCLSPEERLLRRMEAASSRFKHYRNLTRCLRRQLKKIRDRRKRKNQGHTDNMEPMDFTNENYDPNVLANEPKTPEEEAEDQALEEDLKRCMKLGGGKDPKFQSSSAQLIARGISEAAFEERLVSVDNKDIPSGAHTIDQFTETRTRYDCRIQITSIEIAVEKRVILHSGEKRVISADLSDIGPPKMKVTWGFLAHVAVLSTQYALPFNRLAIMLSTQEKVFRSSEICRYFAYVANRFLPLYLHFFKELGNVSYLSGDDASTLVLEVKRFLNKKIQPWDSYRTIDKACEELRKFDINDGNRTPSLALLTAEHMGFESTRADGKGPLKELKVSLIKGRSIEDDPRSLIVFYRSHIGGFGNLLDVMLEARSAKTPNIVHLQTDLSGVNLSRSESVKNRIKIQQYGCLSHARRPFKQYRDENPMLCDAILASFSQVFLNEHMLNLYGRNATNISEVRKNHSLPCLEVVDEVCEMAAEMYPKTHPLGKGARYILNHDKELKAFISNPMISPSNDESEQMVRMESLVSSNSYFRKSIEGRIQFDICRTVGQTAISAGCQVNSYIEWYLRQDPLQIAKAPGDYTPLAYRHLLDREAGDKAPVLPIRSNLHGPPL